VRLDDRRSIAGHQVALSLAACLLLSTACTGDDDPSDPSDPSDPAGSSGSADVAESLQREPAPQKVTVRRVWGQWPGGVQATRTRHVVRQAGGAVTRWMNGGYVDVAYPADGPASFDGAFATFTPGAARDAESQDGLTTGPELAADLVDAVPTRRRVSMAVYAPHGRAVGATASVQLVLLGLRADGNRVETAVTGDLYLTRPAGQPWRVFGYDLQRSTAAPGSYARAHGPDDPKKPKTPQNQKNSKDQPGSRQDQQSPGGGAG